MENPTLLHKLKRHYRQLTSSIIDARAATELSRWGLPYLPWSGSALRPSAVATIVNDIMVNQRHNAVEFGSGISTIYIARALRDNGGTLISFDDDADWAAIVTDLLGRTGLSDVAQVIHAPLGGCVHSHNGLQWYDETIVRRSLQSRRIDLMLADGPKAYEKGKELARYPAYPVTKDLMNDRSVCILDDIDRPGETDILSQWSDLAGPGHSTHNTRFGIGMLCRGAAFTTEL